MRFLFVIVFWLILQPFTFAAPDELDGLVASLSHDPYGGRWMNGAFQVIDLPSDAPPAKVVEQIAKSEGHGDQNNADQFRNYHIVETKKVVIPDTFVPNNTFTAVLIASARGSKSVILRYDMNLHPQQNQQNDLVGWWHRTFYITTVP